jgi:hypothetical protein
VVPGEIIESKTRYSMKKTNKAINALIGLLGITTLLSLTSGCKSTANVACTEVEKFQSRSGVVNIPHFGLGDVILLDTIKKTGQYLLHCQITSDNISATPPIDSIEILTNTGFTIGLTGKVAKANADVQADVKSEISNNTTFFLSNSVRKNVINPSTEINQTSIFPTLKSAIQNNNDVICMFVSGIVYADKFEFRVKKSSQTEASTNIIKVGEFNVKVSYDCQGSLIVDAKKGGVFFKSSFFRLDDAKNQLVVHASDIDLSKYKLVFGIR